MPSFDVVSTVNMQEVRNAIDQTLREIGTRFDFKGSVASVELEGDDAVIVADDQMRLRAVQDIFKQKLSKRGVSLKLVVFEDARAAGGDTLRQLVKIKQGLSDQDLKTLNRMIKDQKLKVTSQIQGDQLRISGKKKDDLQDVIALLRGSAKELELQFVNFRD